MPKDLFSTQAGGYARYRPTYPPALFEYLASVALEHRAAWDCATGNGQAALALTPYFDRVFASDLSPQQLERAAADPKIEYIVGPAEATPFPDRSFDLIAVAQAYHWFDFTAFAAEVRRVAKPGAAIAVWCYGLAQGEDPRVDALVRTFYRDTVGSYWDPERKYVEDGYASAPFPYRELKAPAFVMSLSWTREDLLGYLGTWSSVQHYRKDRGRNPVPELAALLKAAWPGEAAKRFEFPLSLRVGRVD